MATKIIPQSKQITCDSCLCEITKSNGTVGGHIKFHRNALDFQGCAVADASVELDLCNDCTYTIGDAMNKATEKIRAKKKES